VGIFRSVAGTVTVRITSGDIPTLLAHINKNGIELTHVGSISGLTIDVTILRKDIKSLQTLAKKHGASIQLRTKKGIYWIVKQLLSRPVLTVSILFVFFLTLVLPNRVFFIRVEGNTEVPVNKILEEAESCGIRFGALRREVRSERMKNRLLAAMPQLQWAGINTAGCTATITVVERTVTDYAHFSRGVSSIVAARDGIVDSCTVTKGTMLCIPGQAVRKGQTLVSGYTDCGIAICATQAQAEVYAFTDRRLCILTPLNYALKGKSTVTKRNYSIVIGKKRINLFKDSGISPIGCDKMYIEYYMTLPGGFLLPLSLVVEQWTIYDSVPVSVSSDLAREQVEVFAKDYLLSQMVSGQVLKSIKNEQIDGDIFLMQGRYLCREMIGRVRSEEIIINNG